MKKIIIKAITGLVLVILPILISAQQQWKFHLAFKDATGAKDTVWLIYDTNATMGLDTALGEGPFNFNHSVFNVWFYDAFTPVLSDSTKIIAAPYSYYPSTGCDVQAFNYQLPITVSWDTSLFHASYLPYQQGSISMAYMANDYLSMVNNDPPSHHFNMLLDNHVKLNSFAWGSHMNFPLGIRMGITTGIDEFNGKSIQLDIENPIINDELKIHSSQRLSIINVYSMDGKLLYSLDCSFIDNNYQYRINMARFRPGLYTVVVVNQYNISYPKKVIKVF